MKRSNETEEKKQKTQKSIQRVLEASGAPVNSPADDSEYDPTTGFPAPAPSSGPSASGFSGSSAARLPGPPRPNYSGSSTSGLPVSPLGLPGSSSARSSDFASACYTNAGYVPGSSEESQSQKETPSIGDSFSLDTHLNRDPTLPTTRSMDARLHPERIDTTSLGTRTIDLLPGTPNMPRAQYEPIAEDYYRPETTNSTDMLIAPDSRRQNPINNLGREDLNFPSSRRRYVSRRPFNSPADDFDYVPITGFPAPDRSTGPSTSGFPGSSAATLPAPPSPNSSGSSTSGLPVPLLGLPDSPSAQSSSPSSSSEESQESEEEDFDSHGEPDEEILAVVAEIENRRIGRDRIERPEPAPSNQLDEYCEEGFSRPPNELVLNDGKEEEHYSDSPPQRPVLESTKTESDEDLAGLCASSPSSNSELIESPPLEQLPVSPMLRAVRAPGRPPIVQRNRPRDPLREPPLIMEFIERYDVPNLPRHPRAHLYPADWTYGMVAFAEDPFWEQRVVPLPPNVIPPPRPMDHRENAPIREQAHPRPEVNQQLNILPPNPMPQDAVDWQRMFNVTYERELETLRRQRNERRE